MTKLGDEYTVVVFVAKTTGETLRLNKMCGNPRSIESIVRELTDRALVWAGDDLFSFECTTYAGRLAREMRRIREQLIGLGLTPGEIDDILSES